MSGEMMYHAIVSHVWDCMHTQPFIVHVTLFLACMLSVLFTWFWWLFVYYCVTLIPRMVHSIPLLLWFKIHANLIVHIILIKLNCDINYLHSWHPPIHQFHVYYKLILYCPSCIYVLLTWLPWVDHSQILEYQHDNVNVTVFMA